MVDASFFAYTLLIPFAKIKSRGLDYSFPDTENQVRICKFVLSI